jgi:hypothetical protein
MRFIGTMALLVLAACNAGAAKPPATVLDDAAWAAPETFTIDVQSGNGAHAPHASGALATAMHPNRHETFRGESPRDHIH